MNKTFQIQLDSITEGEWKKLFGLIPEMEKSNNFGSLAGGEEVENGVYQMPYWDWSEITGKVVQQAYDLKLVLNFDWGEWSEGRRILNNRNQEYEKLDLITLCKLLTTIIRADRFNDGFLISNMENGTILKIIKALKYSLDKNEQSEMREDKSKIVKTHKFGPKIFDNTRKILVGTLPPESAQAYFSNSTNTRLWDLLSSVLKNDSIVAENTNLLPWNEKEEILKGLSLGITDIIYKYSRTQWDSVKDNHIIPLEYNGIVRLVENTQVNQILFVYKNAARWFLHSLKEEDPVVISKLKDPIELGVFHVLDLKDRTIECILLPSPLNRGEKGQTLPFKLEFYRKIIKSLE